MRYITTHMLLLLSLLMFSVSAPADAPGHCDAQARELAMTAWNEIMPDMSASQRRELQQLAMDVCARHTGTSATTAAADDTNDDGKSNDSFTDYILNGEPADKPGNRRLERRGR